MAAVVVLASVWTLPAQAASAPTLKIVTWSGKCLDVPGGSSADRTPIQQWWCHGGANQRFDVVHVGGGLHEIRTSAGKCFDVEDSSHADGARIVQFQCHGGANQRFRQWKPSDRHYGFVTFVPSKSITITGGPADGARVVQGPSNVTGHFLLSP
ncbi:RICIN domain-containing protein [Nonomuraea sp. NPDC050394]|uniref:RICIN domain-containing protein n=1 Tax=Nonomuraea sp. NPDC050394 TaxID=3364363 RepID=UPI0037AA5112